MKKMNKILTFIVNENKELLLLLLQGSPNDPQFKKSRLHQQYFR